MSDKLKPCPFCKKKGKIFERWIGDSVKPYYQPGCEDHTLDYLADTEEEAIEVWNRRACER